MSKIEYLPAILWVLLSTFLWSLIYAAAKFADGTVGTFQITFLRYISAFATVLVIAQMRGGLLSYRSGQPFTHFLRALTGCTAALAITWASANMEIASATAFGMLYGILVVILGVVFLGEHASNRIWTAVALSLIGALIVVLEKGAFQQAIPIWPALAALASALLLAIEGFLIRILGRSEKALSVMLYVCFFGICLTAVPAYYTWQPIGVTPILACLMLGPVAIIAQYTTIRGYRAAPLSIVGPIDYSWIIFAAVLGFVFFGEKPGLGTLAGGALILTGGVILARSKRPAA